MRKFLLVVAFLAVASQFLKAQHDHTHCNHAPGEGCRLIALEENAFSFVPPPAYFEPNGERAAVISVTYNGFTPAAQVAFQYAVDIWASTITSNVPILITANYTNLGSGVLGSAGPSNIYRNFSGAPLTNTYYPTALANSLAGFDLSTGLVDLTANFNNSFNWYLGTDGNCPAGQYDFVSVVLHELCHGLGFVGSASMSGSNGFIGQNGSDFIYDVFVENNAGTDITTFSNGTTALGDQLTGGQLYWNGPFGMAGNGGTRPRLYAPSSFSSGSSYSHLNEATYPNGSTNSLMTPFLAAAEAIHDPGPIVYGMFQDMGWVPDFSGCTIDDVTAGVQGPCDPATGTYTQQITVFYSGAPETGNLIVNSQAFPITGSPQTVTLTGLTANGNVQNVTVSFSENGGCQYQENNVYTAPQPCCANIRLVQIDPAQKRFTLQNFGTCAVTVTTYTVSSGGLNALCSSLTLTSGSSFMNPGAQTTYQWNAWNPDPTGDNLSLFGPNAVLTNPNDLVDYAQWASSGNSGEALAVTAGYWGTGDFIVDTPPYDFIGTGADRGVEFWFTPPPVCAITDLTTGAQSACNGGTNTYTQQIIVSYISAPASGSLRVNGVNFPITGSPQTVTLTLPATGIPVNVTAFFTAEPGCTLTENALFTSPAPCNLCEIISITAGAQFACTPVAQAYTQLITVTYSNPPGGSSLLINGIPFTLTGSPQTINWLGISDGLPVDVTASFSLDTNCSLTEPALFTAPLPCITCAISDLSAGSQTACDPGTNTYSQDITVTFAGAPASGSLVVNGQNFAIGSSPQTVTLTGLNSDGQPVDVSAFFSADPACTRTETAIFSAPASCNCSGDFNGDLQINVGDILILLAESGCTSGCTTDLNGDFVTNSADLIILLSIFGTFCP